MTYTIEELKQIIDSHKCWLFDGGGECADLSDTDLRGTNLRDTDLRSANLSGTDLRGANLSGTDLRGADLSGTNLRGTDLSGANLRNAYLRGANLSGTNLRGTDLSGASLRGANLILIGQDVRGYLFYGYQNKKGILTIRAGCRSFEGMKAAHNHWDTRHLMDVHLHGDIMSLLDRAERMAKIRGWETEVKEQA